MITKQITILVDDREKAPYTFTDMETGLFQEVIGLTQLESVALLSTSTRHEVTTITQRLSAGDYSLPLATNRVAVERKSLADLVATFLSTMRHEAFAVEMERLSGMQAACVVVEEDWRKVEPESGMSCRELAREVDRWQSKYPRVMWSHPVMAGRRGGEVATFLFLLAFHEKLQKEEGATPPKVNPFFKGISGHG